MEGGGRRRGVLATQRREEGGRGGLEPAGVAVASSPHSALHRAAWLGGEEEDKTRRLLGWDGLGELGCFAPFPFFLLCFCFILLTFVLLW